MNIIYNIQENVSSKIQGRRYKGPNLVLPDLNLGFGIW